jgi:flavorubredoxin
MATVTEIAEGVYRINLVVPGRAVTYSLFLLDDEAPTLIETSFGLLFDEVSAAVRTVLPPEKVRHIVAPHLEGDECGGMNKFLALAPHALPVCSPIGAGSVRDFTEREPKVVADGELLPIGRRRLRFLLTPYVHQWDSLLVFEETQGVLYSSDLFIQPGQGQAVTDQDLSEQMVEAYRRSGVMPSMKHLHHALDKLDPLAIRTIACHHGSVLTGDLRPYFQALRENDVTGVPGEVSSYTRYLMRER